MKMYGKPEFVVSVKTDVEKGIYKGTQLRFYIQKLSQGGDDLVWQVYFFSRAQRELVGRLIGDVVESGYDIDEEYSLFTQGFQPSVAGTCIVKDGQETMGAIAAMRTMIDLCPDEQRDTLEDALYARDKDKVAELVAGIPSLSECHRTYTEYVAKERLAKLSPFESPTNYTPTPDDFNLVRSVCVFPGEIANLARLVGAVSGEGSRRNVASPEKAQSNIALKAASGHYLNDEKYRSLGTVLVRDVTKTKAYLEGIQ
ncbi:hypothetical protein KY360_00135 [Candidatus Woesearchaeota archaeon]|nr:hypothetical protein [Candidatus Woesearchaeota archaeon]